MAAKARLNLKQKRERRRMIPWTIFAALVYASFYIPVLVMILFSYIDNFLVMHATSHFGVFVRFKNSNGRVLKIL